MRQAGPVIKGEVVKSYDPLIGEDSINICIKHLNDVVHSKYIMC